MLVRAEKSHQNIDHNIYDVGCTLNLNKQEPKTRISKIRYWIYPQDDVATTVTWQIFDDYVEPYKGGNSSTVINAKAVHNYLVDWLKVAVSETELKMNICFYGKMLSFKCQAITCLLTQKPRVSEIDCSSKTNQTRNNCNGWMP